MSNLINQLCLVKLLVLAKLALEKQQIITI